MRKALGRGIEALFPGASGERPQAGVGALLVPIAEIVSNPEQPRRRFGEETLAALAESVRRHGLLQPLVVRRVAGHYELIAGERRLRAAERAGLDAVPVVVREARTEDRLELALIENLQREDLTPLEEAEAYRRLVDDGLTQEEIAGRVGKSRPAVANALRLLALPEAVKARLESGELSAGHARAVLGAGDAADQVALAGEIVARRLPKSEAERLAAARRQVGRSGRTRAPVDLHLHGVVEELTRSLRTRVRVTRRGRGGAIELEFYSDAELDRLIGILRRGAAAGAT